MTDARTTIALIPSGQSLDMVAAVGGLLEDGGLTFGIAGQQAADVAHALSTGSRCRDG